MGCKHLRAKSVTLRRSLLPLCLFRLSVTGDVPDFGSDSSVRVWRTLFLQRMFRKLAIGRKQEHSFSDTLLHESRWNRHIWKCRLRESRLPQRLWGFKKIAF